MQFALFVFTLLIKTLTVAFLHDSFYLVHSDVNKLSLIKVFFVLLSLDWLSQLLRLRMVLAKEN